MKQLAQRLSISEGLLVSFQSCIQAYVPAWCADVGPGVPAGFEGSGLVCRWVEVALCQDKEL